MTNPNRVEKCFYCGRLISQLANDGNICTSPTNISEPDTVGNRHHVTISHKAGSAETGGEKADVWWNNIKFCFHCGTPAKRWKHDANKAWCVNCHWVIQDTLLVIIGTGRACRPCDQKVPLNSECRHEWVGSGGGKYVQSWTGAEPASTPEAATEKLRNIPGGNRMLNDNEKELLRRSEREIDAILGEPEKLNNAQKWGENMVNEVCASCGKEVFHNGFNYEHVGGGAFCRNNDGKSRMVEPAKRGAEPEAIALYGAEEPEKEVPVALAESSLSSPPPQLPKEKMND